MKNSEKVDLQLMDGENMTAETTTVLLKNVRKVGAAMSGHIWRQSLHPDGDDPTGSESQY